MYAGRVVESGPVAEVFEAPRHPYTSALLDCVPVLGQPERSLAAIPGLPPAVDDLPQGCAFADRCQLVVPDCRRREILLAGAGDARRSRCLRWHEVETELPSG